MQQILEHIVGIANDLLWSKLLIVLLLSLGIYFTFRLKFLQVRMLKEMVRVLREGAASRSKNTISPFQAFCISMAARVGTGNITGIAIRHCTRRARCNLLDVDYRHYRISIQLCGKHTGSDL